MIQKSDLQKKKNKVYESFKLKINRLSLSFLIFLILLISIQYFIYKNQEVSNLDILGERQLDILTIQSYPYVGGNWTVLFMTIGKGDLKIEAVNNTFWNSLEENDLRFLEVRCGNKIQKYSWINNSVFIPTYYCDEISQEISMVATPGKHTLKFTFGNRIGYAYNVAPTNPNTTIRPIAPVSANNLNCSFTYLDLENETGNGSIIWYNSSTEHFRINISILTGNNSLLSYTLLENQTNLYKKEGDADWTKIRCGGPSQGIFKQGR
jgi:hypothetical protein